MAAEHGPTAGEYIIHHLTHLQNKKPSGVVDFSVFNLDSLFFSIVLGVVGCWVLWSAARKATSGVPGRFQAAVEMMVEMVDSRPRVSFTMQTVASSLRHWRSLCLSGFSCLTPWICFRWICFPKSGK